MIGRAVILASALVLAAISARAEAVVAGLSQDAIAITTNFEGSEILIFGAVRRDTPAPGSAPLEVIITVQGPQRPITVRRKDRIWHLGQYRRKRDRRRADLLCRPDNRAFG